MIACTPLKSAVADINPIRSVASCIGCRAQWLNNTFSGPLASGVPALTNFRGSRRHTEGALFGGQVHVWIWGSDVATPTTARVARCSWTTCLIFPCAPPTVTCSYASAATAAQYVGVEPYQNDLPTQSTYGGAIAALNLSGGPPVRRIYSDGVSFGYTPTNIERDDTDGSWYGSVTLLGHNSSYVLVYGNGTANLLLCTDTDFNGDANCAPITGLPNQGLRSYYDATLTPQGDVLLLASSCTTLCTSATYYLVTL